MPSVARIDVICEGVRNGRDIRLLEASRQMLLRERDVDSDLVSLIGFQPLGGKPDLVPGLRVMRRMFGGESQLSVAIRDRDFLREVEWKKDRAAAMTDSDQLAKAWPLSCHCMESYLLDPEILLGAGIARDAIAQLPDLARSRLWVDVARSVLETVRHRIARSRPGVPDEKRREITSRDACAREVSAALARWRADTGVPVDLEVDSEIEADAADFEAHGPLVRRVDGKELLGDLARLVNKSPEKLAEILVRRVEESAAPAALVGDLRDFVVAIRARLL